MASSVEIKFESSFVEKITIEKGNPVKIDDVDYSPLKLVEKLNEIGGANGIGIADIVEDRLVGMRNIIKSRRFSL